MCPIGYICPFESLFFPVLCPRGFTCNEEGISFPYFLCQPGLVCERGVKSGVKIEDRSCKMLENVEESSTKCAGGTVYYKTGDHYGIYLEGYGLNHTDYV